MSESTRWLTAEQALAQLGVKPQTLYAYVSRGQVKARPDETDPRRSLYAAGDVEAMLARKRRGRRRSDIAASTINWGDPVLESAISTVRDERLIFRGRDAMAWSRTATLEDTACLLWDCAPPDRVPPAQTVSGPFKGHTAMQRGFVFLSNEAASAIPAHGRSPDLLRQDAFALLSGFADALLGQSSEGPIHKRVLTAWGVSHRHEDVIRQALVLMADHELNPSTFAARIAASTGASLPASVLAGFSTLSGPKHGQASARAIAVFDSVLGAKDMNRAVETILRRGERIPGMGHPFYPDGDPRGKAMLQSVKAPRKILRALEIMETATGLKPNVDMAFAVLVRSLKLAEDTGFVLFAMGRMAGWLAHVLEQGKAGRLIRPRAHYIGP